MASRDSRQLAKTLLDKAEGDEAALRAIIESQEVPDEASEAVSWAREVAQRAGT